MREMNLLKINDLIICMGVLHPEQCNTIYLYDLSPDIQYPFAYPAKVVTAVIAGPPASLMRILVNGKAEGPRSAFAHVWLSS